MTGRLPFDPQKMAARAVGAGAAPVGAPAGGVSGAGVAGGGAGGPSPLSVSQLAGIIDQALRDRVPAPVRVMGEISNFTHRTHWYFALKDASSVVSCVMFQSAARQAGFVPAHGLQVVATGRVEFYAPRGGVSLRVEKLEPVGAGALELALRQLVEEARALGWLEEARKRALPVFPRRVAVITSATGAALQDVLNTCRRRCPGVEICTLDVLVQGAAAAPEVARAIRWVSAHAARLDVQTLIVTRGGGSIEDLWAFNDREVARAIVECSIPVAAAIGHETDTTLAELVADARCSTPTQAAMRCTPDAGALAEQVASVRARLRAGLANALRAGRQEARSLQARLNGAAAQVVGRAGRRMALAAGRLESQRPAAVHARRRAGLDVLSARLHAAMLARVRENADTLTRTPAQLHAAASELLRRRGEQLASLTRQLTLVGPESVLGRGYSVTFGPGGTVVRRAQDVAPGQGLTTKLAEGTVKSTVDGLADLGVRHGRRRRATTRTDDGQAGLFDGG